MRNLRIVQHQVWRAPSEITAVAWDTGRDEVLTTLGPSRANHRIQLVRVVSRGTATSDIECVCVASWDSPSPNPDLALDRIVDIHHFGDILTTCLVMSGGDIVIVREADDLSASRDHPHIEIVGSIDAEITAARWSPDDELLAITTNDNSVLWMSRTFDVVAEATRTAEDLKASKHVSVGWGRRETQFQGRGAKARTLRDPTIPEKVDEGILSPNEDGRTTISWRGDGAYLAINSLEPGSRRVIRVYSREGVLDSVSEPVDGLEGTLSWRPSGNLIAAVQRQHENVDIVFFERNGLRHGHFTLPGTLSTRKTLDDVTLEWNSDSTVLAVILRDRIQLWTTGNYHWYLKQEIFTGTKCSCLAWHLEKPLRSVVSTQNELLLSEQLFVIARGPISPPNDYGAVAVIDGPTLKLTPFRTANVPPPMALFEIAASSSIIDIAFTADNSAFAVLHHTGVDYYRFMTNSGRSLSPSLLGVIEFAEDEASLQGSLQGEKSFQIALSGNHTIHVLQKSENGLRILSRQLNKSDSWLEMAADSVWSIGSYGRPSSGTQAYAQDASGNFFDISSGVLQGLPFKIPVHVPWNELVDTGDELFAVGLSRGGHLYANSRQLTKSCTSFLVTSNHIIFTTSSHFVKFIHLAGVEDLEVPPDDPENDERCRSVERGARLITAVPTNMTLIMQMPRGNLETIAPRAMVLEGIRRLIDAKDYKSAFSFCRTQRVDMNILYDHNPEQFLANVPLVIDQLRDTAHIDLFLSSLREEDVSQTLYKDTKRHNRDKTSFSVEGPMSRSSTKPSVTSSKVNTVCDAVLKCLRSRKEASFQNIITAYVCKNPPALDDGLRVVVELMQEDEALAERAVEHMCFLVDVSTVYDHALGLYDLNLALLVARQSQRDPREYLPFIHNLHEMTQLRRQFAIDDHLGRQEKALGHLRALKAFDELQVYVKKHNLYTTALGLYRYDDDQIKILTDLYASHLESVSRFREAGLAYESIGNFTKATTCYRTAGASSWRECLFAAQQQIPPLSGPALSDLAGDLAEALYEAKDYTAAATIQLEYLGSIEVAIRYLCKGYHFADAFRLVSLRNRPDLLGTAVDSGLADALSSSTEFLADCKAQLKAQVPRVLELRRKAVEDPLGFYEGERPFAGAAGEMPDDVSVAASSRLSTSASLFTRYTGKSGSVGTVGSNVSRATSKNRKREEKKRARGRKGTIYEEEYLVNSIRRLVERVESTKDEIERLIFGLVRRGMTERARAIESLAVEVVEACKTGILDIWPAGTQTQEIKDAAVPDGDGKSVEDGLRVAGGMAVLQDSLIARNVRQEPPLISSFAKLSILGS
ncbi:hypothetical protein VTK73DRAFT_7 [Phialemonium thermophilum]|uniref:Elongator complex protein 1 n=1 Tax=Phialemonium thermophilum TaxID=223376 RepID=A0ABR3Y8C4_9PEZI